MKSYVIRTEKGIDRVHSSFSTVELACREMTRLILAEKENSGVVWYVLSSDRELTIGSTPGEGK